MRFAVQELRQACDPNSGERMDMWVVWAWTLSGIWQMAYCSKPKYAEQIKRLLEAEQDMQAAARKAGGDEHER